MSYADHGHRPHAIHTGEEPRNPITHGPESITVELTTWGPQDDIFPVFYDALQSNWGEHPSRTLGMDDMTDAEIWPAHLPRDLQRRTGWLSLTPGQRAYVESAFQGKTLPQILEGIKLHFTIDGVSRAFTHQNVRTRIGAAFMQHGGRDNDWRHRAWTMPETIRRACEANAFEGDPDYPAEELSDCLTTMDPINQLLVNYDDWTRNANLYQFIEQYLLMGRDLYSALVDAGIPWQDARRVLWMGTQTYIHDIYDYLAFKSMLANRLEHIMDYEHNCVAQLMLREIKMKCPPVMSKYLGSHSDRERRATFAGLESWPPDGKYPTNYPCGTCRHAEANHVKNEVGDVMCEACERENDQVVCCHYVAKDPLPRTHRPEQNPFWVLAPSSMAGGPVKWIPSNGVYPWDAVHQDAADAGVNVYGDKL